jgi:hypothetical protein
MSVVLSPAQLGRVSAACAAALALVAAGGLAHAAPPDYDGDGHVAGDCRPLDPNVHPGAVDRPDLQFKDINCDGVDGDLAKAIFVNAAAANDAGSGSKENPLKSLSVAMAQAVAADKDLYLITGTFDQGFLELGDDVGVYGGYVNGTGARTRAEDTVIKGSPQAVLADGATGSVLQRVRLEGTADSERSAYGVRATNGSAVLIEDVEVSTGPGADGTVGAVGPAGAVGAVGVSGSAGTSCLNLFNGGGAPGGSGGPATPGGFAGGPGGRGGDSVIANGSVGGPGGAAAGQAGAGGAGGGRTGSTGLSGFSGRSGKNAVGTGDPGTTPGSFTLASAGSAWAPAAATTGTTGQDGGGGGGGGGGGSGWATSPANDAHGGGGGGGGAGGRGGAGGSPGTFGGGSFGVYAADSSVIVQDSSVTTSAGGAGGDGGLGGVGGDGGAGGAGAPGGSCAGGPSTGGPGGPGGAGGDGARGGAGGGAQGGPSIGVVAVGTGSLVARRNTVTTGAPGVGGARGGGGATAADGLAADTAGTVSTTADFDADTVPDATDQCPADAAPSATGCPAQGALLTDGDGDGVPGSYDLCPAQAGGPTDTDLNGCPGVGPPRYTGRIAGSWKASKAGTTVKKLSATSVPAATKIRVSCKGGGCTFRKKVMTYKQAAGKADLATLFKRGGRAAPLAAGAKVTVEVSTPGLVGKYTAWTMRSAKAPASQSGCLAPGTYTHRSC